MLDLKSKLLAAGIVTAEQVEKAEKKEAEEKARVKAARLAKKESFERRQAGAFRPKQARPIAVKPAKRYMNFEEKQREKQLAALKILPKNEQYETIRRWVERNRLDKHQSALPENTERYFFQKSDGSITWLTLESPVHALVTDGKAAIIMYMSNHGLSHSVVSRDIAEDVAQIFPFWLRVLKDHPLAGKTDEVAKEKLELQKAAQERKQEVQSTETVQSTATSDLYQTAQQ